MTPRKLLIPGIALLLAVLLSTIAYWSTPVDAQDGADPDDLALGAALFQENCAVCHGESGEGRIGATLAKDWPAIQTELRIKQTISEGVAGSFMPPWSIENGGPLTEEEIDALVLVILANQTSDPTLLSEIPTPTLRPPITPIPDVVGDPDNGAVLYALNCAVCHGENGEGRIGATLAKDWPAIRTDLRLRETILRGVEGSFMPAWGQDNGGPLTSDDVDDLVAFVLTLPSIESSGGESPAPAPTEPEAAPEETQVSAGLILAGFLLVIVVIGGVVWVLRARDTDPED
ncbi:MAG: c-type cytochrome [Anaerolineales bacterium]|nr:c-type cytochrome [Anaerolineales bacterium]